MRVVLSKMAVGGSQIVGGQMVKIQLRKADGPVTIRTERETFELSLGEFMELEQAVNGFTVSNDHNADNAIQLYVFETHSGRIEKPSSSVEIANEPVVVLKGHDVINGLPVLQLSAEAGSVPANPNRKKLILQTAAGNGSSIWIGGNAAQVGLEMPGGASLDLNVSGAVPVFGTGDLYALEVE